MLVTGGTALLVVVVTVPLIRGWSWSQPPALVTRAAAVVAVGWAGTGLVLLAGAYGALAVLLVVAASPPVVERLLLLKNLALYWLTWPPCAPPLEQHAPGSGGGFDGRPAAATLLSHTDLCHAWRSSYLVLQRLLLSDDVVSQTAMVSARQGYLDELERRDPAGFERWLAEGARAASDPSRYITPMPTRGPVDRSVPVEGAPGDPAPRQPTTVDLDSRQELQP